MEFLVRLISTAKRNWPLCLAGGIALGLLTAAFIEGAIIADVPRNADVIQDYAAVSHLADATSLTSLISFAFFITMLIGPPLIRRWLDEYSHAPTAFSAAHPELFRGNSGYFTPITPGWTEVPTSKRGHTATHVLIAGLALFASALACLSAIIAAFAVPSHMKTVTLNGYAYHLTHHIAGDGDTMEVLLYECADTGGNCHVIYQGYLGQGHLGRLEDMNLRTDPETNTVLFTTIDAHLDVETLTTTRDERVLFEYQPPSTSARPAPDP
ncbi:hypothetical protein [Aggregatilinea lenta]|uniref:hypothetical protein n=1 Tax=Aggregatilinea lenta TaxID=913108 RepID=UPI0013C326AA|nr:hypothetical protein [Aggregatilinea lenta]